ATKLQPREYQTAIIKGLIDYIEKPDVEHKLISILLNFGGGKSAIAESLLPTLAKTYPDRQFIYIVEDAGIGKLQNKEGFNAVDLETLKASPDNIIVDINTIDSTIPHERGRVTVLTHTGSKSADLQLQLERLKGRLVNENAVVFIDEVH